LILKKGYEKCWVLKTGDEKCVASKNRRRNIFWLRKQEVKNISATMWLMKTGDAKYFGQPGGPERK
jgi:hypothetical protein